MNYCATQKSENIERNITGISCWKREGDRELACVRANQLNIFVSIKGERKNYYAQKKIGEQ